MAAKKSVKDTVKDAQLVAGEAVKEVAKKAEPAKKAARTMAKKTEIIAKEVAGNVSEAVASTKTAAKKAAAPKADVILEFYSHSVEIAKIQEAVKADYIAAGNKASGFKNVKIYVKPEDNAAYYVVNEQFTGRVDLF